MLASQRQHSRADRVTVDEANDSENYDPTMQRRTGYDGQDGRVFLMHWIRSGFLAILIFCPAAIIGWFGERDAQLNAVEQWCLVFLPAGAWYLLTVVVLGGRIAEKVACDMIEERSPGTSIRDSIRGTLTNTGIVSALFLTVVLAMTQMDPFEGPANFRGLWYLAFVIMAVCNCLESAIMCSIAMLYIEPLCEEACMNFLKDNMLYIGEPITRMSLGMMHMLLGLILWTFEAHGSVMGMFILACCWYVSMRLLVCWANLSNWHNVTLPDKERSSNKNFRDWSYANWFFGDAVGQSRVSPIPADG